MNSRDIVINLKNQAKQCLESQDLSRSALLYSAAISAVLESSGPTERLSKLGGFPSEKTSELNEQEAEAMSETLHEISRLLSNRSMVFFKQKRFLASVEDASVACLAWKEWWKPQFRRGAALAAAGLHKDAVDAYKLARKLDTEHERSEKQHAKTLQKAEKALKEAEAMSGEERLNSYLQAHDFNLEGCSFGLRPSHFNHLETVGEGNYSVVHKVKFLPNGKIYALKEIDKQKVDRLSKRHNDVHQEIRTERRVMLLIDHPNIVKLIATFQDATSLYFVQEFAEGGELWSELRYKSNMMVSLPPSRAAHYLAQVVNALQGLQDFGVVHRDLKPENMMLFGEHKERLKLIDFGTSKCLVDRVASEVQASNFVGTPEYMAPEAIHGRPSSFPSDLWSFGCCVYQLLHGAVPFKGLSPYLCFLKADALEYELDADVEPEAVSLIESLLKIEPDERLNLDQVRSHDFFKGIDFDQMLVSPPEWKETESEEEVRLMAERVASSSGTVGDEEVLTDVESPLRTKVMCFLERRGLLSKPRILEAFFTVKEEARFHRPHKKSYLGFSRQAEFVDPFCVVHVGDAVDGSELVRLVDRVNDLRPRPRVVVVSSGLHDAGVRRTLARLDSRIVICGSNSDTSSGTLIGDSYYTFWVGGVLFIVLDTTTFANDDAQQAWFDRMVLVGKLCARHVVIACAHDLIGERAGTRELSEERQTNLRDSGVRLILTGTNANASTILQKKLDLDCVVRQTSTKSMTQSNSKFVRIVRINEAHIVTDPYSLDEFPRRIALGDDGRPADAGSSDADSGSVSSDNEFEF